ncbi:biliverdin-producing heme oxygenase [Jannaschia faecimaris]|uniref:biliverdin-producing heme oxygenase n=1 Tax=Jannaschia faecimaris TaxID=1244108 RepID=UPI0011135BA1|nr:biliverdin-producing heme oxygenase [Jannaschia faecimaris]
MTQSGDLAAFLAAQRDALSVLRDSAVELVDALDKACADIEADLSELGRDKQVRTSPTPRVDDAEGRGYVWHSQQLGMRMLARRLSDTSGPAMRFLTTSRDTEAWRALCDTLEQIPGYGPKGEAALSSANDWLALFETIHLEHARDRS